jgi:hypothetical protein
MNTFKKLLVVAALALAVAPAVGSATGALDYMRGGKKVKSAGTNDTRNTVIQNSKITNKGTVGRVSMGKGAKLRANTVTVKKGVKIQNSVIQNKQRIGQIKMGRGASAEIGAVTIGE